MKIINQLEINASPGKVFYWLEDPDRASQWMTSVTKSEIIEATPDRIGTTFTEYVEEDGRGVEMRGIITEFVPDQQFAVHLESDFHSADVRFTLEKKDETTSLTQDVELHFKGMAKVMNLLLRTTIRRKIKNQAQKEFAALKKLCEGDGRNEK